MKTAVTKMIKSYIAQIESLLQQSTDVNWEKEMRLHLIKISFFQHERLVHLIVMAFFVISTLLVFIYMLINPILLMILLTILFFSLTIAYIKHYYFLENSVQEMYRQYDRMMEKVDNIKGEII